MVKVVKKEFIAVLIPVIALLFLTGCHKKTPEEKAEDIVHHLVSKLDLNDSQKSRLEKIKHEFLVKRPELNAMHAETVQKANAMMRSPRIEREEVNALIEKNTKMLNDYSHFVGDKFVEIHDMLTPEQRNKLVKMIEEHMKEHRSY